MTSHGLYEPGSTHASPVLPAHKIRRRLARLSDGFCENSSRPVNSPWGRTDAWNPVVCCVRDEPGSPAAVARRHPVSSRQLSYRGARVDRPGRGLPSRRALLANTLGYVLDAESRRGATGAEGGLMSKRDGRSSSPPGGGAAKPGTRPGHAAPGKQTLVQQLGAAGGPASGRDPQDPAQSADVHAAAARGIAGSSQPLPFSGMIQRAFGRHDIGNIEAHTGAAAAEGAGCDGGRSVRDGQSRGVRVIP
jgi:hypothetical protein